MKLIDRLFEYPLESTFEKIFGILFAVLVAAMLVLLVLDIFSQTKYYLLWLYICGAVAHVCKCFLYWKHNKRISIFALLWTAFFSYLATDMLLSKI